MLGSEAGSTIRGSSARARMEGTALRKLGSSGRAILALGTVTALFTGGLAVSAELATPAGAIGGLCEGRPASHPWLDASGQAGPTFIEGTKGDDVIVGGDGDDNIFGGGGNDIICGGPGDDNLNAGPGGDSVENGGPGDDDLGTVGVVHSITMFGGAGDDGPNVGDTEAPSFVSGGSGDDTLQHGGTGAPVKMNGDDGYDLCIFRAGDELISCEY
jgi:Ca2+-binding RTX toxin-like protein